MKLTEAQVSYLEKQLRRIEVQLKKPEAPLVSLAARREACVLMLHLNGYQFDFDTLELKKPT